MEKSWKEAIKKVLSESEGPLRTAEISEAILSRGYFETDGATPSATVGGQIYMSIKTDGEKSPFVKVGKGLFGLKENSLNLNVPQQLEKKPKLKKEILESNSESQESIIHSFGMYWQRDLVVWKNDPKMYGKQQAMAKSVDFGKQKGIYILYDHHTVVYIGRSVDRPLGKRLYEHTVDRLGSRWNRFSWFGLLGVTQEGNLRESPLDSSLAALVTTLESLLIEALEPPQNRKRGDDFAAEYIQDIDPELKEREIQNTLRSIESKMRGGS